MARLGVALDAEQRGDSAVREGLDQPPQVDSVQDLAQVAPAILGSEQRARALADSRLRVLAVLQAAKLGGRGELLVVLVADARLRERGLQALRVRPRVLAASHAPSLPHVEQEADVRLVQ